MNSYMAPVDLSKAYRLMNHGPSILVSTHHEGVDNVMAAAWACPLDFTPPRLTVVLAKMTKTRELIERSGTFVIQVPTVAQLHLTQAVGTTSLHEDHQKLENAGVEMFRMEGRKVPFVSGCSAWLVCRLIPELRNQEVYDLFIGEIIEAWSDTRAFSEGHWHFESAPESWRSIHHVAGGHFYAIGDHLDANEE